MFRKLLVLIVLILWLPACFSQLPEDFPTIDKNDLRGAKILSSRTFNGTSLFGYIDGGAELYLEYGFYAVLVTEMEYMGGKYKTEIYKMNGPEEAFGIFSVSKYRCLSMPDLSKFTCQTKYQLQICKGPYYISIINGTGSRSDSIVSLNIGRLITDKIKDEEIDFSSYLPGIPAETIQAKCFLAKGRLGIVNGSPEMEDFFKDMAGYTALILKNPDVTTISVKFTYRESYQKFLELHHLEALIETSGDIKPAKGMTVRKMGEYHLFIELPMP